jgi:hypothetical protein
VGRRAAGAIAGVYFPSVAGTIAIVLTSETQKA